MAVVGSPPKAATKPGPTPAEMRAERKASQAAPVEAAAAVVDVAAVQVGDREERLLTPMEPEAMLPKATVRRKRTARVGTAAEAAAGDKDEAAAEKGPRRTGKWTPRRPPKLRPLRLLPPPDPRPHRTDSPSRQHPIMNERKRVAIERRPSQRSVTTSANPFAFLSPN